ncbi:sugar-binding transcriptional regulator [Brachybacterium phenoliresistens]|uniref:sugar-binding transcriptional regulator n=1 Tax=Brachybacterium phenoliresistens TaxID=396014 RepID=UPI0031DE4ACF
MPALRDDATVVLVARLYYEEQLSQAAVAEKLHLSRPSVSRILAQARDRGIVEISIHDPGGSSRRDPDLEGALLERFGMSAAIVVKGPHAGDLDRVSRAAADVLSGRLRNVASIGVSWGKTMQSVVERLPALTLRPVPRVLPLVGGLSALDQLESGDSVLRVLASKIGAVAEPLFAPAVLGSPLAHAALMDEVSIRGVLDEAAKVDLALVGIGSIGLHSNPHLVAGMRLTPEETREFRAQGPVGDLCGRFVDAEGNSLGAPSADRIVAVDFESLRKIPDVIGVAAGAEKAPGVGGVLRSGVVDTVVVDAALAKAVLASA